MGLLVAMPMEALIPNTSLISLRIFSAASGAGPNSRSHPVKQSGLCQVTQESIRGN